MKTGNRYLCGFSLAAGLAAAVPTVAAAQGGDAELERRLEGLERKLDVLAESVEGAATTPAGHHGAGGRTTVGGYGELHYNNLDSKKEIDFHRAVLFVGHEFNERIRFFAEWDLEHADTGENGGLELEQSYLEFDLNDSQQVSAGVILLPIGILNETHEPPTFYGVDRNPVENKIIPTTWREGGVGLSGHMANGLSYDVLLTTGLNAVDSNGLTASYNVRGGRTQVSEAAAEDLATTARLKWTGLPGVELAASYQLQGNITQGVDGDASASLLETHAVVNRGPLTVKALYAAWNIDGAGARAAGKDEQSGWYIEPSYKLNERLGVFARYNAWDNTAGDAIDSEESQTEVGASYWPHERVVVKADFMRKDTAGSQTDEGFNLGVGYSF